MTQYIHIALVGTVSVGKSTLLNAMLVARYSDMSMQRTTANEIVYYETDDNGKTQPLPDIHELNKIANRKIMDKTAQGGELTISDIKRIEYYVPRIYNLLEGVLKPGVRLAIHDLPGLNDSKTSSVYYQYVTENFHQYDIILFIVDVISGLNTCDEKNILKLIINGVETNKEKYGVETELIVILNKCDEMEIVDKNSTEARPIDEEYKSMVEQVRTIVKTTIDTMKLNTQIRFICLSAEDAYIYRMYSRNPQCEIDPKHRNKFGINEYGKNKWNKMNETEKNAAFKARMNKDNIAAVTELTGFPYLNFKLSNILTPDKQFVYLLNHLKFEMSEIKMMAKTSGDTINAELEKFTMIRDKLNAICTKYKKKKFNDNFFQNKFKAFLAEFLGINKQYLISLTPTKDDSIMYTISTTLTKILTMINESFRCWIYDVSIDDEAKTDITYKNLLVKENIDKYLSEIIACRSTSYDAIINTLDKFIDEEKKSKTIDNLCHNLCSYDFIKAEYATSLNDECKIATRIISIIKELSPDFTAVLWCSAIVQNIKIILNQWSSIGAAYNTDPHELSQIFNKYHIHCAIKDWNG